VVSVAEGVTGPDLPEQVELVRAALPDDDRSRFNPGSHRSSHTTVSGCWRNSEIWAAGKSLASSTPSRYNLV
jgi:hypothetical protein